MTDLTQDLRDYRAHLESELAIMAKATVGEWKLDGSIVKTTGDSVKGDIICECPEYPLSSANWLDNATAIAASRNGYEQSLRAQLRMLDALEASICREVESAKILRAGVGLSAGVDIEKCPSVIALRDIIAAWKGGRA